ncbi:metal ABC transporter permease [Candidatus Dependentiae bacterium]
MDIDILNPQLLSALLIGASVGSVAGYIGSLMITKRMALMGGALGHLALPGVALGLMLGFDVSVGALIFFGCRHCSHLGT